MLIIEQINFNDFNNNLGIASEKEMSSVIINEEEEYQTNLIPLIQRSFEYHKMLNEKLCKKIMKLQNVFYNKTNNNITNEMRMMYLQIIYLISLNKSRCNVFIELFNIDIISFYISNYQTSSDFEIILLCALLIRLISKDISYINSFLSKYLQHFLTLAQSKPNSIKYITLLFSHILNDSQYGESLNNYLKMNSSKIENVFGKDINWKHPTYDNDIVPIWRETPEFNEQVTVIYKMNGDNCKHYIESKVINGIEGKDTFHLKLNGNYMRVFPIIPRNAIKYYCYKGMNKEEIEEKVETVTHDDVDKRNVIETFESIYSEDEHSNRNDEEDNEARSSLTNNTKSNNNL
jgi:hypothetical protein